MILFGLFLNNEMRTGANRRYLELLESLAEKGIRVFVLMNSTLAYVPKYFSRIDLCVTYKRKSFPPASYLFKKSILQNAKIFQDICTANSGENRWIHIHGDTHLDAACALSRLIGARLFYASRCNDIARAKILRKTTELTPVERVFSHLQEILSRIRERKISRYASLVTFQNGIDREDFIKRTKFSINNTVIIPGNIGLPRFASEWQNKNHATEVRNLVYVGVLSLTKGLHYLLDALSILRSRGYSSIHLTVLGKTEGNKATFDLVDKLGISDQVTFAGYTLPFPYLVKSDLMIFPTLYDAFPDAVLEALHTGCPVIGTRIGGLPDLLGENQELLFPLADAPAIADCIEHLVVDTNAYTTIRNLCASRAESYRFDWAQRFLHAMKLVDKENT